MGQAQSQQIEDNDLYRSRSTRSFADIAVSGFRRTLRRIREWLLQKSQPKVEIYELSPMSQDNFSSSIEEALDAQTLEDSSSPIETQLNFFPHLNSYSGVIKEDHAEVKKESPPKIEIELKEVKKLDYLDFPFLQDDSLHWIKRNRIIFLMRGLPGSGKSTVANAIAETFAEQRPITCSADHYFVDQNGIYRFNPSKLSEAHESCQNQMKMACGEGRKIIIVDNTHVQHWEMKPYFIHASQAPFSYKIVIVEPQTPWKLDPEVLVEKNTHEVELQVLTKRMHQFKPVLPLYFGWFLSPADSRSLFDRAMILFKNLYDTCDEFRRNFASFSSMLNWGSAMSYYNRDMLIEGKSVLHCTAKYLGFHRKKTDINPEDVEYTKRVQNSLGKVQRLHIIGFYFTKETVGCRVRLTPDQLEIYDQPEDKIEKRIYGKPAKNNQKSQDDFKESVTIEEIPNDDEEFITKGKRAHITLATSAGVRPVNAGIDLLEIVQAEELQDEVDCFEIDQDKLKHYHENFWVVYLKDALSVESIFTGHY